MRNLIALVAGLVFGLGMVVSDMINPARVLGFLDVFGGAWDPTLAFVMGGATAVMTIVWPIARKQTAAIGGGTMQGPASTGIDAKLIAGAAVFGIGWGLAGLCPGPALAGLLIGGWPVVTFVLAMVAGMAAFSLVQKA